MGSELVTYMNHKNDVPYQHIERLYWSVSTTAIHGVLDHVRTALTQLVAELRHATPDNASVPSEEAASQAVQVIVHGTGHRVIVNNAQASGDATSHASQQPNPQADPPGWKRWARVGGAIVGVAGIVAAVFAVLQYLAT
jgi:hypothetical protein